MEICLLNNVTLVEGKKCYYNTAVLLIFFRNRQFIRRSAATTVGKKLLGSKCRRHELNGRMCRGHLQDTILDWEDNLPDDDLEMSEYHSRYKKK